MAAAANLTSINSAIRGAILSSGVARLQQVYSMGINPASQNGPITINPQNVGIIRGFLVRLTGKLKPTAANAALTGFGLANLLSNVAFADFSNVTRINTTGWHLNLINSAKNNQVFGGAYAPNVSVGYGNNWGLNSVSPIAPASGADATFSFFYYVPLAYSKNDLRGAVFAGLVGSTAQLQLTLNPTPFAAAGSDPTLAVFGGAAGGFDGNVNITVYQDYIDQLPSYAQLGLTPSQGTSPNSPALPPIDMSTIYELINTSQSAVVAGQDFGIAYTNLRTFMSTSVVFDNGGVLNTGSDVNYWALTLANSANVWKYTPDVAALLARGQFLCDPPAGVYYFDHRQAPINTQVYGNAQLVLNASQVNAGAAVLLGYEAFAMTQTIVGAPSVPS